MQSLLSLLILVTPLFAGTSSALGYQTKSGPQPDELTLATERVRSLARELVECGFEFDTEAFTVELLSPRKSASDLADQQDVFFQPEHFPALWYFYDAMGLKLGSRPKRSRAHACRAMARGFSAYFGFHRNALVLIDDERRAAERTDELLLHELAHAWRDQRSDLAKYFSSEPRSFESVRIRQCVAEGEADAIAVQTLFARDGRSLSELNLDESPSDLASLFLGPGVSRIYSVGRRYVFPRMGQGHEARDLLYRELPASTEQLMHPEKFEKDVPVEVAMIERPESWHGLELVHEDTIGELGLLGFLGETSLADGINRRVALGWDGDRMHFYKGENGHLLLWRIAFDREIDAEEFVKFFVGFKDIYLLQAGHVVCWVAGSDIKQATQALLLMSELPAPAIDPDDAHSTARAEAAIMPDALIEDGRWVHPAKGFSIAAPSGWTSEDINGTPMLLRAMEDGFRDSFNLTVLVDPEGNDAERILAVNRKATEEAPLIQLHTSELRVVDGKQAVYMTYGAEMGGNVLEFRVLIIPVPGEQLILTASILADRSEEIAPIADAALMSLRFE